MSFLSTEDESVLVLPDLNDTLGTDSEILRVELLGVLRWRHDKIVRAEIRRSNHLAVAVQELDRHVGAILRKEGDGLLAGLDSVT